MLATLVAQYVIEDRIREAEAYRIARTARPPRNRTAGAVRLRRPAWPFTHPRTGATPR
jgi:hypothetical protein